MLVWVHFCVCFLFWGACNCGFRWCSVTWTWPEVGLPSKYWCNSKFPKYINICCYLEKILSFTIKNLEWVHLGLHCGSWQYLTGSTQTINTCTVQLILYSYKITQLLWKRMSTFEGFWRFLFFLFLLCTYWLSAKLSSEQKKLLVLRTTAI